MIQRKDMTHRSGRTQQMISELVEVVVKGQPRSLVVAATEKEARCISTRVITALGLRGMVALVRYTTERLDFEGSTIWFAGRDRVLQLQYAGTRGVCEFWDHAAIETNCKWELISIRAKAMTHAPYMPILPDWRKDNDGSV